MKKRGTSTGGPERAMTESRWDEAGHFYKYKPHRTEPRRDVVPVRDSTDQLKKKKKKNTQKKKKKKEKKKKRSFYSTNRIGA